MPYTHLTPSERGQIQAYLKEGLSQSAIARRLGRSPSTISRELRRNGAPKNDYDAARAVRRYTKAREACVRMCSLDHLPLRRYVVDKLHEGWSPEQVSGRLSHDFPGEPRMRISHEAIYQSVYRNDKLRRILVPCLRRRGGKDIQSHSRSAEKDPDTGQRRRVRPSRARR